MATFLGLDLKKGHISLKLIKILFVISLPISLITTIAQIVVEYRQEVNTVHHAIKGIGVSQINILSRCIGNDDGAAIQQLVNDLLGVEGIEYASVSYSKNNVRQAGHVKSNLGITIMLPISHNIEKNRLVGQLHLVAGMDFQYQRLFLRAVIILVSYTISIIIVFLLALIVFQYLVIRHLSQIVLYMKKIQSSALDEKLHLEGKKTVLNNPDEIDAIIASINWLRSEHGTAPNQLQEERNISEQRERNFRVDKNFLEGINKFNLSLQGTNEIDLAINRALDTIYSLFDCDRTWVVFPCDPEAPSWRVMLEKCRPEYPGALAFGDIPTDPLIARDFQILKDADGPVTFGPGCNQPLEGEVPKRFHYLSQIAMIITPVKDQPWLFGMHQCSSPRVWTTEEVHLFKEIGLRLGSALTSLLIYQNLLESENKYRCLFENMMHGFAYGKVIYDQGRPIDSIFLEVSKSFESLTGLTNVVGKYSSEVLPELMADKPYLLDLYGRVALGTNPEKLELFVPTMGHWLSLSVYSPQKEYVAVLFDVITENKNREEALQQSEKLYRSLFDNMLNGLMYCKVLFNDEQATDYMFLKVNSAFESLTGLKDIVGKKISEVLPEVQTLDSEMFEIFGRVALSGVPEKIEIFVKSLGQWISASLFSARPKTLFFRRVASRFGPVGRPEDIQTGRGWPECVTSNRK